MYHIGMAEGGVVFGYNSNHSLFERCVGKESGLMRIQVRAQGEEIRDAYNSLEVHGSF